MFKTNDFLNASHCMFLFPFQIFFYFCFGFLFLLLFLFPLQYIFETLSGKLPPGQGLVYGQGLSQCWGHFTSGVIVLQPFETIFHIFFHTCLYSTLFTQQLVHNTSHTMSWNHSRSHTMPVVAPSETRQPRSSMKLQIAKNQKNL